MSDSGDVVQSRNRRGGERTRRLIACVSPEVAEAFHAYAKRCGVSASRALCQLINGRLHAHGLHPDNKPYPSDIID